MKSDPYEILGVSRDASPADLKRAFRRLAMRWHPDRNDHPEATERFKEISIAYELLTEVDDEYPPEPEPPEEDKPSEEATASETRHRAADIRLNMEVTLEEAAHGCRKTVHYYRGKACVTCGGSGEHGMARTRFCGDCHGSGRIRDAQRLLIRCDVCGGRGFFTERICASCHGSGRETAEVSLEINVPPGMLPGNELRLPGQGELGDEGQEPGHLFLTLVIRSHPLFELHGRNLKLAIPVSALAMMGGGEIDLPSLFGPIRQLLDSGSAEPRQLCLAGKGYPGRGKQAAGDFLVTLTPVFPSRLNARQRKLLLQANTALLDDATNALPEIAEWWSRHGLR